jgi:hypothetical protein
MTQSVDTAFSRRSVTAIKLRRDGLFSLREKVRMRGIK